MAGPITWKNVTPVDTSGEVNAYLRAGEQLAKNVSSLGDITQSFVDDRVQANTDMMTAELLNAGDNLDAATAIIQKYSAGNFAPTTASIQKAESELRALGQYKDQLATNALNRENVQGQMDERIKESKRQDANQERLRLDSEQQRKLQQSQIATAEQDRRIKDYEEKDLQRAEENRVWMQGILDRWQAAPDDATRESIVQDFAKTAAGRGLTADQRSQFATMRIEYLTGKAQGLESNLPAEWQLDGKFNPPKMGATDKEILSFERQAKIALGKTMPTATPEEIDKAFETWAAGSAYSSWRTVQRNENGIAVEIQQKNRDFEKQVDTTNLTDALFKEIATNDANKGEGILQFSDEKITQLKGSIQGLVKKVENNFPNMTRQQKLELLRRMSGNIKFDTTGFEEFHWISGDTGWWVPESSIDEMDGSQIYGAAKYIFLGDKKWADYQAKSLYQPNAAPAPTEPDPNEGVMP